MPTFVVGWTDDAGCLWQAFFVRLSSLIGDQVDAFDFPPKPLGQLDSHPHALDVDFGVREKLILRPAEHLNDQGKLRCLSLKFGINGFEVAIRLTLLHAHVLIEERLPK